MNQPTKTYLILALGLVIVVALIWWGAQQRGTEESAVRIGFIAPLTGPFADWGRTIEEGAQLALEDTNHSFNVDWQDSNCDPQQTVSIARKMLDVDGVKIIIGPGCVTGLRAIAPLAEEKNALLFSTGLLDDSIFEEFNNIINLATQISTEADNTARYLASQGIKKIAVIHGTNYFGEEYGRRLPEFFEREGIEITSLQPTSLDEQDFRTIVLKAVQGNPGVIFIHQGELQVGLFAKQLRELGYNTQLHSYYSVEQQSVIEAGGDALEGLTYSYPVNSAEGTDRKQEFERRYGEKFGERVPSASSYFVYDGLILLDQALERCTAEDTACVANFFKSFGKYNGVSGDMTIEPNGSVTRPFGAKQIEDGEFIWLTKEIP